MELPGKGLIRLEKTGKSMKFEIVKQKRKHIE